MFAFSRVVAAPVGLATMLTIGCGPVDPATRAGVVVDPPAGWTRLIADAPRAPGRLLGAWSGPDGSSLVVYRVLPPPDADPSAPGVDLANRLSNLPGLGPVSVAPATVGGRPAARVEAVGPGDGASLAPSGLGVARLPGGATPVPTRRVAVAVAGRDALIWLVWHLPESRRSALIPQVEATLKSARVAPPGAVKILARNASY